MSTYTSGRLPRFMNLALIFACVSAGAPVYSLAAATTTTEVAPKLPAPASISDLSRTAQAIFDASNVGDWSAAATQLSGVKDALKKCKARIAKPNAEEKKRLTQITNDIKLLDTSVPGKQRQAALIAANRVIRVSGVLTASFITDVPQSVLQMEYLARELIVWTADPVDLTKLKSLAPRLETEWAKLQPAVLSKVGEPTSNEIVDDTRKLKSAVSGDDFLKQAAPLLSALQTVEKAYRK